MFCVLFVARSSNKKYANISWTAHRIFHLQSFYDLMLNIFEYKCKACDGQRGFKLSEQEDSGLRSGHNVIYNLYCDNCDELLLANYESSPRVTVNVTHTGNNTK